ncbi:HTH_Tnp_Tc3_2 domain-containing protein [Trichonephila clavipes]|nr:HTH_Tnp_Tc3_2 domain-containing protein [Trichonephila clavipes]
MNPDSVSVLMTTARVWRRTGQRSDPAFIVEAAYSNFTRYVDDILTPIVLPMLSSRPGAIYQQDNARPHTARLSQQCLQGYDVPTMACQVTRSFANRACLGRWEGNCSRPEIQEN